MGFAERETEVGSTIDAEHVLPQLMGPPETTPVPVPFLVTFSVQYVPPPVVLNVAVTVLAASIVTVHVPVPEHPPPLHPANVEAPGVAVSVTDVPLV